ncbi:MAG: YIP1 family protein [Ignavibacteria bacterium]|nr:YIP1 family protein [Ignavibacteria bacterium]
MLLRGKILKVLSFITMPREAFRRIDRTPRWKVPVIFVAISSLTIGWCMIPAMEEPLRKIYDRSFGNGALLVASVMKSLMVISVVVETSFRILRWVIVTSTLYGLSRYFTGNDDNLFRRLFAIVAYSEVVFVLMSFLNLLVVYTRGVDRIESSADLTTVNKGLEIFFDAGSNPSLTTLLNNINAFSILYILILSIGFSVATRMNRSASVGFVSLAWLVWVLFCMTQPFIEEACLRMIS